MNADEFESQLEMRLKDSSSPVASYKTNNRIQQATSRTVQPRKDDLESLEVNSLSYLRFRNLAS
jgi:hypothetical protein